MVATKMFTELKVGGIVDQLKGLLDFVGRLWISAVALAIVPDVVWESFGGKLNFDAKEFISASSPAQNNDHSQMFTSVCYNRYAPIHHEHVIALYKIIYLAFIIFIFFLLEATSKSSREILHVHNSNRLEKKGSRQGSGSGKSDSEKSAKEGKDLNIWTYVVRIIGVLVILSFRMAEFYFLKSLTTHQNINANPANLYFGGWWYFSDTWTCQFFSLNEKPPYQNDIYKDDFWINYFVRYVQTKTVPVIDGKDITTFEEFGPFVNIPPKGLSEVKYLAPNRGNENLDEFVTLINAEVGGIKGGTDFFTPRGPERTFWLVIMYAIIGVSIIFLICSFLFEVGLLTKRIIKEKKDRKDKNKKLKHDPELAGGDSATGMIDREGANVIFHRNRYTNNSKVLLDSDLRNRGQDLIKTVRHANNIVLDATNHAYSTGNTECSTSTSTQLSNGNNNNNRDYLTNHERELCLA